MDTVSNTYQKTKNSISSSVNSFQGLPIVTKIFIIVVIVILIIFIGIWIYVLVRQAQYRSRNEIYIVTTPINAYKQNGNPVKTKSIPNPTDGLNFTYSLWIYIADWNYRLGSYKNIFHKDTGLKLDLFPKQNHLRTMIATTSPNDEECNVQNIPLQKWIYITYVLSNRTVDIFINGKLERTCVLKGIPKLNNQPVKVADGGGFWGQIANMKYFTRALLPEDIEKIYSEGPYTKNITLKDDDSNDNNNDDTPSCPGGDLSQIISKINENHQDPMSLKTSKDDGQFHDSLDSQFDTTNHAKTPIKKSINLGGSGDGKTLKNVEFPLSMMNTESQYQAF